MIMYLGGIYWPRIRCLIDRYEVPRRKVLRLCDHVLLDSIYRPHARCLIGRDETCYNSYYNGYRKTYEITFCWVI
jgi:hypothetical protein